MSIRKKLSTGLFFQKYPGISFIVKWLIICSVLGGLIGTASAGFLSSLHWVTALRETHTWLIFLLPVVGFLIGWVYYKYGKDVEAGNNLLLKTIHHPNRKIPFKMTVFVYGGTILTHLFGGSAGREGTAIQMAGSIADQLSRPFRLTSEERKILLIAAVAAGFGSVFGTPLAGAVFGLEVFLIGRMRYNALLPAFLAAVLADGVTRLWGVPHAHYVISYVPSIAPLSLLYIVVAGIIFGLCAALFSKFLHRAAAFFKSNIAYPPLRPVLGGGIIIALAFLPGGHQYLGLGLSGISEAFNEAAFPGAFLLKIIFTVITLAAGFKGGEVTPLFFIGATLGSALALVLPLPVSLLAGMGFVAVFAGATNTPLACTLMGIELFGAGCGIYIGLACVIAYLMSGHNSIYKGQVIGEAKNRSLAGDAGKAFQDL